MSPGSLRVTIALAVGLGAGLAIRAAGWNEAAGPALELVQAVGGAWLDLLRMTVVPLLWSLLVTAVAQLADAAATGRLAGRAVSWFGALLAGAATYGILATSALLAWWPVHPTAAAALRASVTEASFSASAPGVADWIRSIAPSNVISAAANDEILPLVVFGLLFGSAVTRLPEAQQQPLVGLLRAIAAAMIEIVRWVLWLAPVGVFALSVGVGAQAGLGAAAVLLQYVVVVSSVTAGVIVAGFGLAALAGVPLPTFARAAGPVLVMAFSTQSSLACLPAMLGQARDELRVPDRISGLVLPLAVAVFRLTSPVANLAVALFLARVHDLDPTPLQVLTAGVVALAVSLGSVGLPGQVSFFSAMAPICIALGVPLDLLPVLLAVEVIPDLFRTMGNVTGDLAVTAILGRPRLST